MTQSPLTIVRDSREQRPLPLERLGVHVIRHGLAVGDYALVEDCVRDGAADGMYGVRFAWERKSIEDFVASWGLKDNRRREVAKLRASIAAGFRFPYVVVGTPGAWARDTGGRLRCGAYRTAGWVVETMRTLREKGFPVHVFETQGEAAAWIVAEARDRRARVYE